MFPKQELAIRDFFRTNPEMSFTEREIRLRTVTGQFACGSILRSLEKEGFLSVEFCGTSTSPMPRKYRYNG